MSIVNSVLIPALVNISCDILSEVYKSFKKRKRQSTIEKEINAFIGKYINTDLDSGSFHQFISSNELVRDIIEYVNFCVYRKMDANKVKSERYLTKDVFLSQLSEKARLYVYNQSRKSINIHLIYTYFKDLISIVEDELINQIEINEFASIYFISNIVAESEKRILNSLKTINIYNQSDDSKLIFDRYIKLLKMKYKFSHVYGIDDLDLNSFYVFPEFIRTSFSDETNIVSDKRRIPSENSTIKWNQIFNESHIISIIGGAGFGKTLFLSNLINRYEELDIYNSNEILPIYCDLKQYSINKKKVTSYSIEEFLLDCMVTVTGMDRNLLTKDFLNYYLSSGKCLILFDALDEVEANERKNLNEIICDFFEVVNMFNRVIITSRSLGFIPKTKIVYAVKSVDLEQIREYLNKMVKIKQFESQNIEQFLLQCEKLINTKFLTSLLTVSLLVQIYKAEKELPENKIDLYDKCVEYIAKKREKDQKKSIFNFQLMSGILDNNISFEMLACLGSPNNNEIDEEVILEEFISYFNSFYSSVNETKNAVFEFLNFCSQRTELFVSGNSDKKFRFYHRSFYEYFISKFIINKYTDNESLIKELLTFGLDSEVFELTIAILKKQNHTRYRTLTLLVFNKFVSICTRVRDIKANEIFLAKYGLILRFTNLNKFDEKLFRIFFNKRKILSRLKLIEWGEVLVPIFKRYIDKSGVNQIKYFEKYYEEEFISLTLIDHYEESEINFYIFGFHRAIFFHYYYNEEHIAHFKKLLINYSVEELVKVFNRYYRYRVSGFPEDGKDLVGYIQHIKASVTDITT